MAPSAWPSAGDTDSFERARQIAKQIVQASPAGDAFSVILMGPSPRRVVGEASEDARKVTAEIQALRLPHGNADLGGTIALVEDLLRQSPAKFLDREVYFLTDLQQATWIGNLQANPDGSAAPALSAVLQKLQERARTIIVDVGQEASSNLAVTRLSLASPLATTTSVTPITAAITHYGPDLPEKVRVELLIGKGRASRDDPPLEMHVVQDNEIKLSRGLNTITFPYKFTSPGEYVLQVRIAGDSLPPDDVRSAVITVKDAVPVMLVNGKLATAKAGGKLSGDATEWLRIALNPGGEGQVAGPLPARPKVVTEMEFNDAGLGDLTPFDCVFLCDVKQLTPPEISRLETHVRQGGGVVFCLGDQIDLNSYNDTLFRGGQGLLPCRLVMKQEAPTNTYFHLTVDDRAYRLPPLDAFSDDNDRLGLLAPRFREYIRAEVAGRRRARSCRSCPLPAHRRARRPRRSWNGCRSMTRPSSNGNPCSRQPFRTRTATEKPCASRGRVLLITTPVNMDWSTWPAYRSFLPLMEELLAFTVQGKLREQAVAVGEPLEEFLPITGGGVSATLHTPDDRTETVTTLDHDDVSLFRWLDTDISGIYRAGIGQHPRDHLFAVNVPTATEGQIACESDPTRTNAEELHRAYPGWDFQLVTELKDVQHGVLAGASDVEVPGRSLGPLIARGW